MLAPRRACSASMTAMSAPRSATNAPAEHVPPTSPHEAAPSGPVEIRLPGTAWTYQARELLKSIGLRWDPATHAWHGALSAEAQQRLASIGAPREFLRNGPSRLPGLSILSRTGRGVA